MLLCWISVMWVKPMSETPLSVCSQTISSSDLNEESVRIEPAPARVPGTEKEFNELVITSAKNAEFLFLSEAYVEPTPLCLLHCHWFRLTTRIRLMIEQILIIANITEQ